MSLTEKIYNMSEWLRRPTKDQNLNELDDLTKTQQDSKGLKWFRSRQIVPTVPTGYYDADTGQFVLGSVDQRFYKRTNSTDAAVIVTDTVADATSEATEVLTVPAGHAYKVILVAGLNDTRAPRYRLNYAPSGGTSTDIVDMGGGTGTQLELNYVLGEGSGAQGAIFSPIGPLWMQAGDVLTLTDETFVAADVVLHVIVYEDYTL